MANAFYAAFGSCRRNSRKSKSACYKHAVDSVSKGRKVRKKKRGAGRKCKYGMLKNPVRDASGRKRICKKKPR